MRKNEKDLKRTLYRRLAQLPQFLPYRPDDGSSTAHMVHALTGARVSAIPDPDNEEHGLVQLQFPGAVPVEVVAALYFNLQLSEAAAHYTHSPDVGKGAISNEAKRLYQHLAGKHQLG